MHQVNRPICTLSNYIKHFEAPNKPFPLISSNFLEFSHLSKVVLDLLQTFIWQFLVEPLQQRNVSLELFVVVPHVYERSKDVWWEQNFESFAILFDRVQKPEAAKTM